MLKTLSCSWPPRLHSRLNKASFALSLSRLTCISGAPPVMSSVVTSGDSASISKHLSAVARSIISLRFGEDSTWQWEQAWLQYRPMFNWRMAVAERGMTG